MPKPGNLAGWHQPPPGRLLVVRLSARRLSAAAGPDNVLLGAEPDQFVAAKVRLTRAEAKQLTDAAHRAELPDWELIRKALRAFGLIGTRQGD